MSTDYSDFDAAAYLRLRFTLEDDHPKRPYMCDSLDFVHDFFQNYRFDAAKTTMVEIGGGPSILHLVSAAPHVSEIVFSDYTTSSLEQVDLWKKNAASAFNWGSVFDYVAKKEGLTASEKAHRQTELRMKLSKLCSCDLTGDPIIDKEVVPKGGFDILLTSGAIEAVAQTEEEYFLMQQKCSALLTSGGIMLAIANQHKKGTTYKVTMQDTKALHAFCGMSEAMLRHGMDQAGLTVERFHTSEGNKTEFSQMEAVYRIIARKNSAN